MKTIKQVTAYTKKVIPFLNLWHWEIHIRTGDDEDNVGRCYSKFQYKKATIELYDRFWNENEDYQKTAIIHELLHCHFSFWKNSIKQLGDSHDQSYNSIMKHYNHIMDLEEESVTLLARSLYELIKK
jgi:hypothetical protein